MILFQDYKKLEDKKDDEEEEEKANAFLH